MAQTSQHTGSNPAITDKEFNFIRTIIYDRFGINLTEQKRSLMVGRLQAVLKEKNFTSFNEYYEYVISDRTGQAIRSLIDRISTNYTYFNRENAHFELLQKTVLPNISAKLKETRSHDLRIWCAGCSSGEEPYMLAILVHEFFGDKYKALSAGVLATDISGEMLNRAQKGIYNDEQIEKLPKYLTVKYFSRMGPEQWVVKDFIRQEMTFRRLNLMNSVFPFKKPFHIIFCRNVMIYFDTQTRNALVRRFYKAMEPGGYFFIGHAETLGREQNMFKYLSPAVYQRI
jgi:chemotaxis protein methyltransferase CheR